MHTADFPLQRSFKDASASSTSLRNLTGSILTDSGGTLLCVYVPPIRGDNGREVTIFQDCMGAIYAEVLEYQKKYRLPVRGYPQEIVHSPDQLKAFFSFTYFVVERSSGGAYSHVVASIRLRGGILGDGLLLPSYPGYRIGSLVSRIDLILPLLFRDRSALQDEIFRQQDKLRRVADVESVRGSSLPSCSMIPRTCDEVTFRLTQAEIKLCAVDKKIKELMEDESNQRPPIQEMLPIDDSCSRMRVESRSSFKSDRMDHLLIKGTEETNVKEILDDFLFRLFSDRDPTLLLPQNTLKAVSKSIQEMVYAKHQIVVIGAFIELGKTRVIDPIKIRDKALISEELKANAQNLCVVTEAVMGGAFLGYGQYVVGTDEDPSMLDDKISDRALSAISACSFTSQGAIVPLGSSSYKSNLLTIYNSWKEALTKDEEAGYPIEFGVRNLNVIFKENGIDV